MRKATPSLVSRPQPLSQVMTERRLEDVEIKITKPLEDEIRSVTGLKDVKSISQAGLSTIVVRVDMDDSNIDVEKAMSDIQKAIDAQQNYHRTYGTLSYLQRLNLRSFPSWKLPSSGKTIIGQETLRRTCLKKT